MGKGMGETAQNVFRDRVSVSIWDQCFLWRCGGGACDQWGVTSSPVLLSVAAAGLGLGERQPLRTGLFLAVPWG